MFQKPAYSYRDDPAVPAFDDRFALAVMDGECALCSRGATFIARHDRGDNIRICAIKGQLGSAMAKHYGIDPDDPSSWLFVHHGHAYSGFNGFIETGKTLGGFWALGRFAKWIPRGIRNGFYHWIARNRIRWFGKGDICALPDSALRARLIDD